jgi:hypothetical protein
MKALSDIRQELLAQHASLKSMAVSVRNVAMSPPSPTACSELAGLLYALGDGIDAHNAREEHLLGDVLPTVDTWGSVRAARMDEHHRKEHRRIADRVRAAADLADFTAIVQAALPAIEELLEHMREEEEEVLCEDVLRDDIVSIDQFDG